MWLCPIKTNTSTIRNLINIQIFLGATNLMKKIVSRYVITCVLSGPVCANRVLTLSFLVGSFSLTVGESRVQLDFLFVTYILLTNTQYKISFLYFVTKYRSCCLADAFILVYFHMLFKLTIHLCGVRLEKSEAGYAHAVILLYGIHKSIYRKT